MIISEVKRKGNSYQNLLVITKNTYNPMVRHEIVHLTTTVMILFLLTNTCYVFIQLNGLVKLQFII